MSDELNPTFESPAEPVLDSSDGLQIEDWTRRIFDVEVVKVTEQNLELAAGWCGGQVLTHEDGRKYVQVPVWRPINKKQTMAFVGDRVLKASTGFKVYTEKAFLSSFVPKNKET